MIFCYLAFNLYDGLQIWASSLHQILCRPRKFCFLEPRKAFSVHWQIFFKPTSEFWVACSFRDRPRVSSKQCAITRKRLKTQNKWFPEQVRWRTIRYLPLTLHCYGFSIEIIAWELSDKRKKTCHNSNFWSVKIVSPFSCIVTIKSFAVNLDKAF